MFLTVSGRMDDDDERAEVEDDEGLECLGTGGAERVEVGRAVAELAEEETTDADEDEPDGRAALVDEP